MSDDDYGLYPLPYRDQLGWPGRSSLEVGGLYVLASGDCAVWEFVGLLGRLSYSLLL